MYPGFPHRLRSSCFGAFFAFSHLPGSRETDKMREKSTRSARCRKLANTPSICITKREDNTLPLGWQTLRQLGLKFVALAAVARLPAGRAVRGLHSPPAAAGGREPASFFTPQNLRHCGKKFVTLPVISAATAPEYELGNSCAHGNS